MTSRDLVLCALNHRPSDRVPRDLSCSPEVESLRADEVAEIEVRYPRDIVPPDFSYPSGKRAKGKPDRPGEYTDAWGCTWRVPERTGPNELVGPPLTDSAKIADFQPPLELLATDRQGKSRLDRANRSCGATSRFVLAQSETRPFDRLQWLRGRDAARADLAAGGKPIRSLLAMLHDFSCQEMEMWAATEVDGVAFGDDWGSPDAMLVAPEIWREFFRPLYREYCDILHAKDKFVFFQSDGNINKILGDLVKVGIDAVNCQLSLMDVDRLAKKSRGQITFWSEIDRERALPFGTPEEIAEAVKQIRRALDFGSGGVIARCDWASNVPMRHVAAFFEQWLAPLPMHH